MQIGVPRETKDGDRRVAVVPDGVRTLVADGHRVVVETEAGAASGFGDEAYRAAGATIVSGVGDVWASPLIVKVKEIQPGEYARLTPRTTILGFAQLHRDPALLDVVLAARVRIIAYEAVRDAQGHLPLLAPMSRIAGRLAPIVGARALQTDAGGNGTLLAGVDGVPAPCVLVLGAGNVGREAARVAARLGCDVLVLSRGSARLGELASSLSREQLRVRTGILDTEALRVATARADLVIGAVLEPGRLSPKLVHREHLRAMRAGSALVDVGIDQGGIAETSRMTSLANPMYVDEGVVHYGVPNMPALVTRTATQALAAAALPYVRELARDGIEAALAHDAGLAAGAMVWDGDIVHAGLAADTGRPVAFLPVAHAKAI